ncbi:MAG: hypothetical protein ACR2HR_16505 [Euzebya sp.]
MVRLAGERPNLLVVAGEDIGAAAWFAEVWPERVLTVPPLLTRLGIGEGIIRGGGDSLIMLDSEVTDLPVLPESGIVMVSQTPAHLRLAYRAGLDICQPGWIEDLPALLVGALGHPQTTLLFLPPVTPSSGDPPPPTTFGQRRVLHRGGDGLLLGAGATAPAARRIAQALAQLHLQVTALDSHTITAASDLDAFVLHDHVLVGPLDVPRATALTQVAVAGDLATVVSRVQQALLAPHP